jgi:hypothetical protein
MSVLRRMLMRGRSPRLLFAAVFCAMVLNGIAYVAHQHRDEPVRTSGTGHTELCGYCATFGGLHSAPSAPLGPFAALLPTFLVVGIILAAPVLRRPVTAARPRAPPR